MLFLLFQLGKDRYALKASDVVEVVPLVALQELPQAPKGVAGIFNYRGRAVPAIDLCGLTLGQAASERLSTRIIIVHYADHRGKNHLLGLIAEHATEMLRQEPEQFTDSGLRLDSAPYLGPVLMDGKGAIQWVHHQRLLPEPVRDLLFS
jgi:chemotaxis-related protein WspB